MAGQLDSPHAQESDSLVQNTTQQSELQQTKNKAKAPAQSSKDSKTLHAQKVSLVEYKLTMYENIWRIVFIALLIAGGVAVQKVYLFHTSPITRDIPKGHWSDFWISVVSAVVIACLRYLVHYFLFDTFLGMLSEKRMKSVEEGKKRADQLCKWFFDFCYYSLTTICGYLIVKDQIFLSPALFGSGSCSNLFMSYPEVPDIPFLRLFYLIQAGTHLYTFTHQFLVKYNDPKFYEYALHHGLALFLLWFSYMMNFILVGVIVLLVHDPGDVFLIAGRAYTDLKNRNVYLNMTIYAISYPIWVYTRNIVFPACVISQSITEAMSERDQQMSDIVTIPKYYMVTMMGALAVMHIYWTFFLTKAAISMLGKGGKDKNGYDS